MVEMTICKRNFRPRVVLWIKHSLATRRVGLLHALFVGLCACVCACVCVVIFAFRIRESCAIPAGKGNAVLMWNKLYSDSLGFRAHLYLPISLSDLDTLTI